MIETPKRPGRFGFPFPLSLFTWCPDHLGHWHLPGQGPATSPNAAAQGVLRRPKQSWEAACSRAALAQFFHGTQPLLASAPPSPVTPLVSHRRRLVFPVLQQFLSCLFFALLGLPLARGLATPDPAGQSAFGVSSERIGGVRARGRPLAPISDAGLGLDGVI